MKAILLAAGVGTRISRYIREVPKSTVEIASERPLIADTVDKLRARGVSEVLVVTGYRENLVREALSDRSITYVCNPFFHRTNSIASLWFAREALEDDIILMNADTFMEDAIFDRLFSARNGPVMLADSSRQHAEMDYKLGCQDGLICSYGKDLDESEADMEYVGAAWIGADDVPAFRARLESMIANQKSDCWWEDALYSMVAEGGRVRVVDVAGLFWAEVDYYEDYLRIRRFLGS